MTVPESSPPTPPLDSVNVLMLKTALWARLNSAIANGRPVNLTWATTQEILIALAALSEAESRIASLTREMRHEQKTLAKENLDWQNTAEETATELCALQQAARMLVEKLDSLAPEAQIGIVAAWEIESQVNVLRGLTGDPSRPTKEGT